MMGTARDGVSACVHSSPPGKHHSQGWTYSTPLTCKTRTEKSNQHQHQHLSPSPSWQPSRTRRRESLYLRPALDSSSLHGVVDRDARRLAGETEAEAAGYGRSRHGLEYTQADRHFRQKISPEPRHSLHVRTCNYRGQHGCRVLVVCSRACFGCCPIDGAVLGVFGHR